MDGFGRIPQVARRDYRIDVHHHRPRPHKVTGQSGGAMQVLMCKDDEAWDRQNQPPSDIRPCAHN